MRSVEEIRNSIKDLIEKAESAETVIAQEPDQSSHSSNNQEAGVSSGNDLSDEILNQINLEVSEFQKAFQEQGAEGWVHHRADWQPACRGDGQPAAARLERGLSAGARGEAAPGGAGRLDSPRPRRSRARSWCAGLPGAS